MTRAVGLSVVLFSVVIGSFVGCGGGDDTVPVGDNGDGAPPSASPGAVPSSGGFGSSNGGSSSSNGATGVACGSDPDCPEGDLCIDRICQGTSTTSSSGGSSGTNASSGGVSSSSGGNASGKGLAEPCSTDAECASNLCTTTRQTGELLCSKSCTRGQDNWDFNAPNDATNCPEELPLCGDERDAQGNVRPTTICRHDT